MATDHIGEELFVLVAERVKLKKDSLKEIRKHQNSGIEGWLRVETITALGENVEEARYVGPDILLKVHGNNLELVLKAAVDFDLRCIKKGATDYKTYCLFLGDGSDEKKIKELLSDSDIDVTSYETFSVNGDPWIIGMIKPSEEYLTHH